MLTEDVLTGDVLTESNWLEWIRWLLRLRRRMRVTGESMTPTLRPGDEVFVNPGAFAARLPTPGDIVVARHPYQPDLKLIKRVQTVSAEAGCYLISDNPDEGADSRSFGQVPIVRLIGKVTSVRRLVKG